MKQINKSQDVKKRGRSVGNFQLFPDVNTLLDYIAKEQFPTISSISRAFKMHRMTASEIIYKLKHKGLVTVKPVGPIKIIKLAEK